MLVRPLIPPAAALLALATLAAAPARADGWGHDGRWGWHEHGPEWHGGWHGGWDGPGAYRPWVFAPPPAVYYPPPPPAYYAPPPGIHFGFNWP